MKKIYTTFIAISCITMLAYAKTSSFGVPGLFPYFNNTIPPPSSPGGTTLTRIIARSSYKWINGSLQPSDSDSYTYSMGRGGLLNDEYEDDFVNFETSTTYVYDVTTASFVNKMYRFQDYHTSGKPLTYTMQKWKTSTNSWRDSARFQYTYDNNFSRLTSTMFQIWFGAMWTNHVFYNNVYDAANHVVEMNSTIYKMALSYDLNGRLAERIDQRWAQATGWDYSLKMDFNYDVSGHIDNYIESIWDGSSWINNNKFELTFLGNDLISQKEYHWQNNNWEETILHTYTYDQQHNKLIDKIQIWNGTLYTNSSLYSWTYDGFNQPLTYDAKSWDINTNAWVYAAGDFSNHYYYQTYNPTSVFDNKKQLQITAYPIPATTILNINIKQSKTSLARISIFDTQGKLLQEKNESSSMNDVQTIAVDNLPTGQYFLKATTEEGFGSLSFTVVK